jgi:hypothetical protein
VQQFFPVLGPLPSQVVRQLLDGHPVDAGAPMIGLDSSKCLLQILPLAHHLHQRLRNGRAFGLALRHRRFGAFSCDDRRAVLARRLEGQPKLFFLPLSGHESRVLLAAPFIPLRGPFGPSAGPPAYYALC